MHEAEYALNLFESFSLQAILSTFLGCFGHLKGSQMSRCIDSSSLHILSSGAKRPAEQTGPLEDLRSPPCTAIAKMRTKCRSQKAFCQDLQKATTEVEAHTWPTPGAECALWAAKEFLKLVRTLNQRGMAPFPYVEELREKVQAALDVGQAGYVLSAQ